jgi:hypothetical protein
MIGYVGGFKRHQIRWQKNKTLKVLETFKVLEWKKNHAIRQIRFIRDSNPAAHRQPGPLINMI